GGAVPRPPRTAADDAGGRRGPDLPLDALPEELRREDPELARVLRRAGGLALPAAAPPRPHAHRGGRGREHARGRGDRRGRGPFAGALRRVRAVVVPPSAVPG